MTVKDLLTIIRPLALRTEIYILDAERTALNLDHVEVEYPVDNEGEICVNIVLQSEDE